MITRHKVALVVPPLHCFVNEIGHGYMPPLGLLSVAGPLVDHGVDVHLVDADAGHLDGPRIAARLRARGADVVMLGHSGSIASHPAAMRVAAELRAALPSAFIVYGGVYPSFHHREILRAEGALDAVVRGEGEESALELVMALEAGQRDLGHVRGLTWRRGAEIVVNRPRPPIEDLDRYRRAWELVDWELYRCFQRRGRAAVVQLSRGCPNRCSFCGQWRFWRRWRHRSVASCVDELALLRRRHGVKTVWIADENWACDPSFFHPLLETIARLDLGLDIYCAQCAEDVVRDAALMPLYKRAGVLCMMMGVESLDPEDLRRVAKRGVPGTASRAVELLRGAGMLSVVNKIYGIRDETWSSVLGSARAYRRLAPDYFNAMHLTPLAWTAEQRRLSPMEIAQPDLGRWDFRQPVLWPRHMSLLGLAVAVKLIEALVFFRPWAGLKRLFDPDPAIRRTVRDAAPRLIAVYLGEWWSVLAHLVPLQLGRWWSSLAARLRALRAGTGEPSRPTASDTRAGA